MVYNNQTGVQRDKAIIVIKLALVSLGLLIGMSGGFWVAVRTIPLPTQTVVYIPRN